ncbi:MAG: FG-GAP repeat domain-containing protein [bacterium]|jgi:hypothetical protein
MRKFPFDAVFMVLAVLVFHSTTAESKEYQWEIHVINADSKFEAAGVGDINGDGRKDIVCGEFWYEAPDWKAHRIAELEETNEYYNDFSNELQDVDNDGDLDIVNCAWFTKEVFWRENPGAGKEGLWKTHSIDTPGNMETGILLDLNQDGEEDFLPNVAQTVVWYEKVPKKAEWIKHDLSNSGAGHGMGAGDINQDGIFDIVTLKGWYEGKKEGDGLEWEWHPEFVLGDTCIPIEVDDVNGDGLSDIVWGMGHDYGVFWLEQGREGEKRVWTKHEIDTSWSQAHYIEMVDMDGDGQKELITGKRYRAHNGGDPGADEPLCIYIYDFDREENKWHRIIVSEGGKYGFGLNGAVADVDGDGDYDLVCPGKSGLYYFEQK